MAEIGEGGGSSKGKKGGQKKQSTRMDMTPMVDLGFLLLTFFVLTATLAKPQTMQVTMPEKPKEGEKQQPVKESETVTVVLGKNNKVFYFQGKPNDPATKENLVQTDYSSKGIRKALLDFKTKIGKDEEGKDKMIVIIKPTDDSKYRNAVDILDEMNITGVKKYAIVDITPEELTLIKDQNN
jgi:biopolymer transport protein ExbD